jgi:hypothetical protein
MFHLDPNEMIGRSLAIREQELRRSAERARLVGGDRSRADRTARSSTAALRRIAGTLTAFRRRSGRSTTALQEGCG